MKKLTLLFAASALILASCGSDESKKTETPSQAQIDSIANMKAAEMENALKAKNDSVINAMAKAKADSTAAAMQKEADMKKGHGAKKAPKKAEPKVSTTPPPPPVKTEKDSKFDKMNGDKKATQTPEEKKKKDDKFNRMNGGK